MSKQSKDEGLSFTFEHNQDPQSDTRDLEGGSNMPFKTPYSKKPKQKRQISVWEKLIIITVITVMLAMIWLVIQQAPPLGEINLPGAKEVYMDIVNGITDRMLSPLKDSMGSVEP